MRNNIFRRIETLEEKSKQVLERKPERSEAYMVVRAVLDRIVAIRQGADATEEERAELEASRAAIKTELNKRRREGRIA